MKLFFGNDHAAYTAREALLVHLRGDDRQVIDLGWDSPERSDYPDFAHAVAKAVAAEPDGEAFGVLICGSGIGMCIAANKVAGIRAALVLDEYSAEMSRRHNNANIICLRNREQAGEENLRFLDIFLNTPFEGGRHAKRVAKIEND